MAEFEWDPRAIKVRAANAPWYRGIEILILGIDNALNPRKVKSAALIWEDEDYEPGAICDPSLTLERDEAQVLMDDLWACGLRPTEGRGSAGSLAATERHLEDMRTIAFDRLKIERK